MTTQRPPLIDEVPARHAAAGEPARTPRRPLLAAIASLVLPGLGQFYNGRVDRALWFLIAYGLVSIPLLGTIALFSPPRATTVLLALCALVAISVWLGSAIDAWRDAARLATDPEWRARPWQTASAYAAILIVCHGFYQPIAIGWMRTNQVQPFRVPSASMEPTLLTGDMFFADMSYNCPGCRQAVAHDDIAIFVYPNDRTRYYVKRIIALPGDRVEISAAGVRVQDRLIEDRSASRDGAGSSDSGAAAKLSANLPGHSAADTPERLSPRSLTVPPGSVFVLGDNRASSTDSREFGSVPLRDVVGKVRQIWFSRGPDGIRWKRLGLVP